MKLTTSLLATAAIGLTVLSTQAASVNLGAGTYSQNFDGMNTSTTNTSAYPVPGWEVRVSATESSLGSQQNPWPSPLRAWTHSTGQGKNVSSTNIPSTSTAAEQTANTNRAIGIRQVSGSGFDTGASLNFNFGTQGVEVQEIKMDLLMLAVTTRSTTWELQVGVGASPTSFTTLYSWTDTGVWGSTTVSFDSDDFGALIDGQSDVWFRFAALTPATGTGSTYDLVALDNFSITTATTAVPEPSVFALLGLGILGAACLRRRK